MSDLTDAISILKIPPIERKASQVLKLMLATQNILFFKQIIEEQKSDEAHAACCRALTYKNYEANDIIFNFRDEGTFFGIILKGRVRVLIPSYNTVFTHYIEKKLQGDDKEAISQNHSQQLSLPKLKDSKASLDSIRSVTRPSGSDMVERRISKMIIDKMSASVRSSKTQIREDSSKSELSRSESITHLPTNDHEIPGYAEINRLGAGACFGELSLLTDAKRAATIQCIEPTVIAILSKNDYKTTLASLQEKQINSKVYFLQNLKPFQRWSKLSLMKLSYFFTEKTIRRGQILYKEGDPASNVYFIKSGEFKFTKNMIIESTDDTVSHDLSPVRRSPFIKKSSELQILIKGPGEMFGHDEILDKNPVRINNCSCTSFEAELYVISDKDFLKRIPDPVTWEYINSTYSLQNDWKQKRMNNLKEIEEYKHSVTFTPNHVIQTLRSVSPTPRKEDPLQSIPKEAIKLHRNPQVPGVYHPSESFRRTIRSYTKAYNRELHKRNGEQYIKSLTPVPQMYENESRAATFQAVFPTELRPGDLYLNNRIRKERRPPPNFLPSIHIIENPLENLGSISHRLPELNKFKPKRLKPTRSLSRRHQNLYKDIEEPGY
jgi:CRP-like cAMP-binding protein